MVGATRLHRRGEGLEHRPFGWEDPVFRGVENAPWARYAGGEGRVSGSSRLSSSAQAARQPPLPPILPRDHRWDRLHRLCARRFLGAHVGARLAINREELAISKRTFGGGGICNVGRMRGRKPWSRRRRRSQRDASGASRRSSGTIPGVVENRLGTRAGTHRCNVRGGSARDPALALRYLSGPLQLASLPGVGSDAATTDSPVSPPDGSRASPLHAGRAASLWHPERVWEATIQGSTNSTSGVAWSQERSRRFGNFQRPRPADPEDVARPRLRKNEEDLLAVAAAKDEAGGAHVRVLGADRLGLPGCRT